MEDKVPEEQPSRLLPLLAGLCDVIGDEGDVDKKLDDILRAANLEREEWARRQLDSWFMVLREYHINPGAKQEEYVVKLMALSIPQASAELAVARIRETSENHAELKPVAGIGGRTCSGKGVVMEALASVNREVLLLQTDCYFHKNTSCTYKGYPCIEHTDCISFDRLIDNLHSLKKGKDTVIRIETPWMMPQGKEEICVEISHEDMLKKKLIIIDGFLIFAVKELVDLFDYRIFIDVSDENILYRRVLRNGVGEINKIHDVVIPVSKEYEQIQKDRADLIVDGNKSKEEVINNAGGYLVEKLSQSNADFRLGLPPKKLPWKVHFGDLLIDHEWHPIDYEDLKDWVKERKDRLDAGEELKGNTFRYRRNPHSGTYEVRLSHKYLICHYTREPT